MVRSNLDCRLSLVASMVRPGKRMADIGTDHAYLPVWLVREGISLEAVATDIRRGPLASAARNVADAGLTDRISLRLCSGLSDVEPGEADDIVIAGMGGELIASILEQAPWVRNSEKQLVLQPMTADIPLRRWLLSNGFLILEERAVCTEKHVYLVILARYDGVERTAEELFCITGKLQTAEGEAARRYRARQKKKLAARRDGLLAQGKRQEAAGLDRLIDRIPE